MRVLSLDPGFTGAMAYWHIDDDVAHLRDVLDLPVRSVKYGKGKRTEIHGEDFALSIDIWGLDLAICETVNARPGQGVTGMFRFGYSTGIIVGVCHGLAIPVRFITPQRWRKSLGLTGWDKNGIRQWTTLEYPAHKDKFKRVKDSGRADAVAIGAAGIKEGLAK